MITRETELAILYEISSLSTRLRDIEGLCEVALDKATRLLSAEVAVLYLHDQEAGLLCAHAAHGLRLGKVCAAIPLPPQGGAFGEARTWQSGEPLSFPADPLGGHYPVQAALGVPISAGTTLLGWLYAILADRIGGVLEITLARERERQQRVALEAANGRLEQMLSELRSAHEQQQALVATIRELSTPVLAVADRVVLLPLVGSLDSQRSAQLTERMLQAVAGQHARTCIIDITGVPVVDTAVADLLLRAAAAVRLLGAQVVLCGIAPEVAQVLVSLGADLAALTPAADLRSALRVALAAREGTKGLRA